VTEPVDAARVPERILIVHNRYRQRGGEDGVFEAEADLLASRGHTVHRFAVDNDTIEAATAARRVRLAASTVWSSAGVRLVERRLRETRAELMHVHNTLPLLSPAVHVAARRLGVPSVQTLHNYRLSCPAGTFFRDGSPCEDCRGLPVAVPAVVHACYKDSRQASAAVAAMLAVHRLRGTWTRDVAAFVALTAFARDRLRDAGLPAERVWIKPNFLARDPGSSAAPGSGFLYLGRLAPEKGVDVLLDAWRELPATVTLTIAGSGPLGPRVEAAVRPGIEHVELDRDGVYRSIRQAAAVVVPSLWYEGFPLVVLEAFASGRPVIAARIGSLAEIVEDGVTGFLVPPGDPSALAAAVATAAGDPDLVRRMGAAARATFERHYTADRNYERLLEIYRAAAIHVSSADGAA
jgi:glycosyltransferase involved in cell wall biosynthesis